MKHARDPYPPARVPIKFRLKVYSTPPMLMYWCSDWCVHADEHLQLNLRGKQPPLRDLQKASGPSYSSSTGVLLAHRRHGYRQ
jgi:hypothetical protein